MSRGDRCIEPPGIVPEQRGKYGEVMAQPLDELLHRGRGGPDHEGAVAKRARGLDQGRASSRRTGVHPFADGLREAGEERADQEQGANGPEATHPLLEGTVLRVEEPSLVEERRDPERALAAGESPAVASGGEHLPQGERAAGSEGDLRPLRVPRAAEAGGGMGNSIRAPPSSTQATVVDAAPRAERNTRVGPWEEMNARAPGPTESSRSSRSPSTRPPPSVLV